MSSDGQSPRDTMSICQTSVFLKSTKIVKTTCIIIFIPVTSGSDGIYRMLYTVLLTFMDSVFHPVF